MQRHSFMARLSVRNEDGSVSVLRLICLVVLALCMLSYGITLFARDDDKGLAQSNSVSERESEPQLRILMMILMLALFARSLFASLTRLTSITASAEP